MSRSLNSTTTPIVNQICDERVMSDFACIVDSYIFRRLDYLHTTSTIPETDERVSEMSVNSARK